MVRFRQYEGYPCDVCKMSRQFNPTGCYEAAMAFLEVPTEQLDIGYAFCLQREARQRGSDAAALDHILCGRIQEGINAIIALKAWMCFRMQANNFLDKKIRREVWAREIALLRK